MHQEIWNFPPPNNLNPHTERQLQPAGRTSELRIYPHPSAQPGDSDRYHSTTSSCEASTVNSPAGKANKDLAPERKTSFDTSLARFTYSFPTSMYPSPYQQLPIRRRRSDMIGYTMDLNDHGPFFTSERQSLSIYTPDRSNTVKPMISAKFDRGFFLAENDWTCYRRNYFQLSAAFTLHGPHGPMNVQENAPLFIKIQSQHNMDEQPTSIFQTVVGFSIGLAAKVVNSEKRVELVQHTAKRDKGPQSVPVPRAVNPGGNISLSGGGENHNIVTFERVQFKMATANNGTRRAAQQYYTVVVDLYATTSAGEMHHVMSAYSQPLVVRGRSPGHYADSNQQRLLERYNSLPSMESADGRYFGPTQFQNVHSNDPLRRPFSPYSPYPPFLPATPVIATPSNLRNPGDLSLLMSPSTPYPSHFVSTQNYTLPSITGSFYTSSPDMFSNDDVYDGNQRTYIAGVPTEKLHESTMGLGLQGVLTGGEQGQRGDTTQGEPSQRISAMESHAHNMWVARSRTDSMASAASFVSTQSTYSDEDPTTVPVNATGYQEYRGRQGYDEESYDEPDTTSRSHRVAPEMESTPYATKFYPSSSSNSGSAQAHDWNDETSVSPPLPSPYQTKNGHKQTLVKSKSMGYISMSTAPRHRLQHQTYTHSALSLRDTSRQQIPRNGSLQSEAVAGRKSDENRHNTHLQYRSWIDDFECDPDNPDASEFVEPPPTPTSELTTIITNLGFRMGRMEDDDEDDV